MSWLRKVLTTALVAFSASLSGQDIAPTRPEPKDASVIIDSKSVKAGDAVLITLNLNVPATKAIYCYGYLYLQPNRTDSIQLVGNFAVGQQTLQVSVKVPDNVDGGSYLLNSIILRIDGERRDIEIAVPAQTLRIEPKPKFADLLPSKATAEIVLSQRQFIRVQTEPLVEIRDDLVGKLDKQAADTAELRRQLIVAIRLADSNLPATKAKYISLYTVKPPQDPVLFDDLHNRYSALLTDLQVPRTIAYGLSPSLVTVQLIQRQKARGAGTYPPTALATLEILNWNVNSYLRIASTGIETFSIALSSHPVGATVSYKKIGEDYTPLGQQTNMTKVSFPYAVWTFKFEKEGCREVIRKFDPIIDSSPTLDVEISCKEH